MHSQVLDYDFWVKSMRWLARAGSMFVVGIILLFLVGEGQETALPIRARDLAGLLLFPVGVVLGMFVSWKYELEGAFLSIGSLIGFYVICYWLVGNLPGGWAFLVFTSPAFLFLLSGTMEKLKTHGAHSQLRHL